MWDSQGWGIRDLEGRAVLAVGEFLVVVFSLLGSHVQWEEEDGVEGS